ncbi:MULTISPECIES: efflux RND transporter periplasmic adaptor subunit [Pseudomonadati]|uniref:Efflux RND transporter periplasmic adaptor subunit n=1 Tax=Shewanella aestuarii TaxID=1028752 RepID=A0ABT0L1X6_9GAMM|nr:efflux RND transporter periplasmic adaptor subunit [Shewanella aestuarii]MCL1117714.1 efflux RND transporter periplasmic adaptor subunit [Shewanella aestuarii]GGN76594.1 RND transporter MFP subunit [Shewanella aestuarii]
MEYQSIGQVRLFMVGLFSLLVVSGCGSEVKQHSESVSYQTVATTSLTPSAYYQHQQTYTGTIRSANTTGIGFELAGKLNSIQVDSGDSVTLGQTLASLDTDLLQAEKQQLEASLQQTKADLDLAENTLKRTLSLKDKNYVSEQQLDETKQQVTGLIANSQRLNASLYATNLKLEKSILVAPFNGKISKRHHNLGEVIGLGSPVFTLIGNDQQLAYIGVPVQVASSLKNNQQVAIRIGDKTLNGSIAGISAEVDAITRTVQLRISLPTDADVLNGEIAYLEYQQNIPIAGYWVPISALTDGVRGLWNVYVLDKQADISGTNHFSIQRRDVEIIYTNQDKAYIKGALSSDDTIIVEGLHKLVVGQVVTPATTAVAGAI